MGEGVVLEGHLRYAGDYDDYGLYLDNEALVDVLGLAMPDAARSVAVASPYSGLVQGAPEPWAVIGDAEQQARQNWTGAGPYVYMTTLLADYGRVRITIERVEGGE